MTTLSTSRRAPRSSAVPDFQRVVLIEGAALVILGGGTAAWLLAAHPTGSKRAVVLIVLFVLALGVLGWGIAAAGRAQRRATRAQSELQRAAADVANAVSFGDERLRRALEEVRQGRTPAPPPAAPEPRTVSGPFGQLLGQIEYSQLAAYTAVVEASDMPAPNAAATQQVTVLVNLARRLQSLVHQGIRILDELEQQVEDPDLLRGLFEVDHIATRIRRYVENVAVLGGEVTRRQWRKPVPLASVVRSAIGEVERYSRVKPVPPIDGRLDGGAVADVVHLLAELIENATAFSPPGTQVYVRTQRVTTGLVVEIEDRGLGQEPDDERMRNALLSNPERVELGALLNDGRVGLYVVAVLARQHSIRVELRRNLFGGVTSLVLLPNPLLAAEGADDDGEEDHGRTEEAAHQEARRPVAVAPAQPQAALSAAPAPAAVTAPAPVRERAAVAAEPVGAAAGAPAGAQQQSAAYQQPYAGAGYGGTSPYPQQATAQQAYAQPQTRGYAEPQPQEQTRQLYPQPGQPGQPQARTQGQPTAASEGAGQNGRPPLPQRTQQTHMAPQLQRPQSSPWQSGSAEEAEFTPANPGLMATYRRGVRAAEEQSGLSGE
ncbi:sensor histidine kinase [Actinacidiphila acididurans]|uniref:histidine kinase n=1 Tax=Actinacidiphila acididurans TaxID=2784346 RepID=A0ABS2TS39_9ACTN|nr:ATP-binding protein [Actinacidiphila acididurans]MBM9505816.1 ATP-binding protein [Actinacidiphila acididurans]